MTKSQALKLFGKTQAESVKAICKALRIGPAAVYMWKDGELPHRIELMLLGALEIEKQDTHLAK